ncbi:MAG: DegT/DnrJ/EryC1/StrS family aminotransferase [Spirochaetaceae bacterium]|jgi:dTDP-4-amino-4,6-dideoxygalactose transaminase|nr:DegT/DnrJ/EryC1/StrS family aminotransferase [Spirochaetaceae bacterium]
MLIEFCYPTIRRKEMDAVLTVMVDEKIGPGEQAERLIQTAKERLGFEYCIALRSPAMALFFALKLLDLPPRSGVVISSLSPAYYIRVLEDAGLTAVFCDVGAASPCPDAATISAALSTATGTAALDTKGDPAPDNDTEAAGGSKITVRAVVLHHNLGFMPDMEGIAALGIPFIEDCSAAYMSGFGEKKAGTYGVFTILGLEERDMLTSGGGALLYASDRRNAAVLRNAAELPPEYGLPDVNAAMALTQFKETEKNLQKRGKIAELYTQSALRQGRHKMFVCPDMFEYNNYAFPLILETGMKEVAAYAKRKEIAIENAFSKTPAGMGLVKQENCPTACSLSLRAALFPIYPRLGDAAAMRVAKLIQTLP